MQNHSDELNLKRAMELANSPAGRQLLAILQKSDGEAIRQAAISASAGDYAAAKQALSAFTATPEVQKLLDELGR